MNILLKIIKRRGSFGIFKLIKEYYKGDSLLIAFFETILLGLNSTALEILDYSLQFKVKKKLIKMYKNKLVEFDENYEELPHEKSNKVWVCWFQGFENAPEIVKICCESIKKELSDKEIIFITEKNMFEYVNFPNYILEKWNSGIISHAHMSDLLRLELLTKYGGLWIDSTVFCSNLDSSDYIFDSELFFYQVLEPERKGSSGVVSNWLISACTNNKILMATKHLLYYYWKNNNSALHYFIFHLTMQIVLEHYPEDWKKVIPIPTSVPHILLFHLFEPYDKEIWNLTKNLTKFHKLTYKIDEEKTAMKGTYYEKILLDNN